jgi:hypothetical protein
MKTTTWICDTCGGTIANAEDGWVEWLTRREDGKRSGRGLRLVHRWVSSPRTDARRCQYDGDLEFKKNKHTISDTDLPSMLGPGGLMDLLSMVSDDEVPKEESLEMIKRLHISGYEQARRHFKRAISEGIFEPNTKPGYYNMSDIQATIEWAEKNEE